MTQTQGQGFPTFDKLEKTKRNADAIIRIGKGIYDEDMNEENFININKSEITKNKQEWVKISSEQKSFARKNPYIKDNYENMLAKDIYRTAMLNFYENSEIAQMSPIEFNNLTKEIHKDVLASFKELNIQPKNYADVLKQFAFDMQDFYSTYMYKHEEYTYQNCMQLHAQDLAYQLNTTSQNFSKDSEYLSNIEKTVQQKIEECINLGIPKDDIATNIIYSGFYNYFSQYETNISNDIILSLIKKIIKDLHVSLSSQNLDEILRNMLMQAYKQYDTAQKTVYENKMIVNANCSELALIEFLNWYKSNKYANPSDIDNIIMTIMAKYNLSQDKFFNTLLSSKIMLKSHKNIDSYMLSELEFKSITGCLSFADIENAILSGSISIFDALRFSNGLQKDVKPELVEFFMSFDNQFFDENKELAMQRNFIAINLDRGRITLKEALKQIEEVMNK